MDVDSLVSLRDAADMLGVSRQKVQQLITEHRLPAVRIGGNWQLSVVDVERCGQSPRRSGRPLEPSRAWQVLRDAESAGQVHMPRSKAKHDAFWLANLVRFAVTSPNCVTLDSSLSGARSPRPSAAPRRPHPRRARNRTLPRRSTRQPRSSAGDLSTHATHDR